VSSGGCGPATIAAADVAHGVATRARVVALFRDSAIRRAALAAPPGDASRYSLYGVDELEARRAEVVHNLERAPRTIDRAAGRIAGRALAAVGGYGGDFASVFACRRAIGRADVVFSTVDTLGIPFVLARRWRLVARTPFVYTSIGLLERVARVRGERLRNAYRAAVGAAAAVIAYGSAEATELERWLSVLPSPPPVRFIPFGVDTDAFAPLPVEPDVDVLAIGADPHRDYRLLAAVAARTPEVSYAAVTAPEQEPLLRGLPNVAVETGVPFARIAGRLARGRVIALPVVENTYSGATTVLLQALAMAKPVVVTRTVAIAVGYGLVDGDTCRLVPPGDVAGFARAVDELLSDAEAAAALGRRGRAHVERNLTWRRYADSVCDTVLAAATGVARETAGPTTP
jgi:glycosyltransferase involved in cell wall biosynthesis